MTMNDAIKVCNYDNDGFSRLTHLQMQKAPFATQQSLCDEFDLQLLRSCPPPKQLQIKVFVGCSICCKFPDRKFLRYFRRIPLIDGDG